MSAPAGPGPTGEPPDTANGARRVRTRHLRVVPAGAPAPGCLTLRRLPTPGREAWEPLTRTDRGGRRAGTATLVAVGGSRHDAVAPGTRGDGVPVARRTPSGVSSGEPPEVLVVRLVQALMDVVAGHRPASQVLRWSTAEVFDSLRQRARVEQAHARRTGARRRPVVKQVLVQQQRTAQQEPAVEVAAVVIDGPRVRAVAARLDGREGRWRLTDLTIG